MINIHVINDTNFLEIKSYSNKFRWSYIPILIILFIILFFRNYTQFSIDIIVLFVTAIALEIVYDIDIRTHNTFVLRYSNNKLVKSKATVTDRHYDCYIHVKNILLFRKVKETHTQVQLRYNDNVLLTKRIPHEITIDGDIPIYHTTHKKPVYYVLLSDLRRHYEN